MAKYRVHSTKVATSFATFVLIAALGTLRGAIARSQAGICRANESSSADAVSAVPDANRDGASERSVVARLSTGRVFSRDRERRHDAGGEG